MKTLKLLAAGLLFLCTQAMAATVPYNWTDTYDPNPDILVPPSHSFTFDITDGPNGFRAGQDEVTDYGVEVNLYSNPEDRIRVCFGRLCSPYFDKPVIALVDLPGLIGDRVYFNLEGEEAGGWSLAGWLQLNQSGTLDMSIRSFLGSFYFGEATLNAEGYRQVSEPGSLMLLGIGLLAAFGAARRRNR
jgi:hypothetical protein